VAIGEKNISCNRKTLRIAETKPDCIGLKTIDEQNNNNNNNTNETGNADITITGLLENCKKFDKYRRESTRGQPIDEFQRNRFRLFLNSVSTRVKTSFRYFPPSISILHFSSIHACIRNDNRNTYIKHIYI